MVSCKPSLSMIVVGYEKRVCYLERGRDALDQISVIEFSNCYSVLDVILNLALSFK